MTGRELRVAINKYRTVLKVAKIKTCEYPLEHLATDKGQQLQHCYWMLDRMEKMLTELESDDFIQDQEGKWGKLMRWLGFIQGVLWTHSVYSIEQLKEDNRGSVKV